MALVSLVPTVVNAVLIVVARVLIAAVAPKAINAATNAYSIKSCPDSSLRRLDIVYLKFLISVLLCSTQVETNLLPMAWCIYAPAMSIPSFPSAYREILTLVMHVFASGH